MCKWHCRQVVNSCLKCEVRTADHAIQLPQQRIFPASSTARSCQHRGFAAHILGQCCKRNIAQSQSKTPSSCLASLVSQFATKAMLLNVLQKHSDASEQALQLITRDYDSALPRARSGAALAVKACADFFDGDMLMTALHFLLEHGLADVAQVSQQKATVSEQMMQAGRQTENTIVLFSMRVTAVMLTDMQSWSDTLVEPRVHNLLTRGASCSMLQLDADCSCFFRTASAVTAYTRITLPFWIAIICSL